MVHNLPTVLVHLVLVTIASIFFVLIIFTYYKAPKHEQQVVFSVLPYGQLRFLMLLLSSGLLAHVAANVIRAFADIGYVVGGNADILVIAADIVDFVFVAFILGVGYQAYQLSKIVRRRTYYLSWKESMGEIPAIPKSAKIGKPESF